MRVGNDSLLEPEFCPFLLDVGLDDGLETSHHVSQTAFLPDDRVDKVIKDNALVSRS
jgi:hypothetical protein